MSARNLLPILLAAVLVCAAPVAWANEDSRPVVTIGVVVDGPVPDQDPFTLSRIRGDVDRMVEETLSLTRREFDLRLPDSKKLSGNWDLAGIRGALDQLLADPEVDLVLALGVFASNDVARRPELPKPVVAPFAIDVYAQTLPLEGDASGVRNLNYLVRRGSTRQDLEKFQELVAFGKLHVIVDKLFLASIPELRDYSAASDRLFDIETYFVGADSSAQEVLATLPEDAEAVYITPLVRMPLREWDQLIAGLTERRLPSFSLAGEYEVERGVMAGIRRRTDETRLARRVALNIQRILLGEDAGTLPVTVDVPQRLLLNQATARAVGFFPSWATALEAETIGMEGGVLGHPFDVPEVLDISGAVRSAVQANLSLRAAERGVAAAEATIGQARSQRKTQVDLSALGVQIDEDRAEASFGNTAERTGSVGLTVSQLIFADGANADVSINRRLQQARELDWDAARLDVALEAATAFLDVLRARTQARVEQDNTRLTESNLELARRRERVGYSGAADVYRWESQLATSRTDLVRAHAQLHAAYLVLNQVLNRPLQLFYEVKAPTLADSNLITGFGRLGPYVGNEAVFDLFREFSVQEGLDSAPELQALQANIQAQQRLQLADRRSFWAPELFALGEVEQEYLRDGAGSQPPPGSMVTRDRTNWSLSLSASLPLYTGGLRKHRLRESSEELARLRLLYETSAQNVEVRVRVALYRISATFPAIELARKASIAANKNLELVTDAYSRGAVSVIQLLDAQNAALVADLAANNAVFDFLIDLMELQRATNRFDFFESEQGREEWFERLDDYFSNAGVKVR